MTNNLINRKRNNPDAIIEHNVTFLVTLLVLVDEFSKIY